MKGTHIAITFNSNIYCNCCEYKCAPFKKGRMEIKDFVKKVHCSLEEGYTDYVSIEGGEPFLNPACLFKYIKGISKLKVPIYIRTNGYWGNRDPYYDILKELRGIGLYGIIFEYDFYHSASIYYETIIKAIEMSQKIGLETKIMAFFNSDNLGSVEDIKTFDYLKMFRSDVSNLEFIFCVKGVKRKLTCNYLSFK